MKTQRLLAKLLAFALFSLSLLQLNVSSAQSTTKDDDDIDGHFYIMGGWKTLKVPASRVDFNYIDDSPAPDSVSLNKQLNNRMIAYNIALGFDFNMSKCFFGKFNLDLFARQVYGFNVDLGGGVRLNAGPFDIMPGIDFSMGGNYMNLGKIPNSESYVQVDKTIFAGEEVNINASDFFMGIKPGITIHHPITRHISLRMNGGYYYNFLHKPTISFSGKGEDGQEDVSASKNLNDPKVNFALNGLNVNALPYNYNGFFFNIGIAINIRGASASKTPDESYDSPGSDKKEYKYESPKPKRKLEEKPKPKKSEPVLH